MAAAQNNPAAGTVTAIPATSRLTDGSGNFLTATVGTAEAHEGFCGFFAKQQSTVNGEVTNVATALDLIDNTTPAVAPIRSLSFYELAPIVDFGNGGTGGTHSPSMPVPWDDQCTSQGGNLLGQRMAFRLRGNLHVTTAGVKTFLGTSDDGYSLRVGGTTVMEYNANRGPATDTRRVNFAQPGVYAIELIYWEQGGESVMELYFGDGDFGLCAGGGNAGNAGASGANCGGGNQYADRSNGATPTTANLGASFALVTSARVGLPTWGTDATACNANVGQPNNTCAPSSGFCGNGVVETTSTGAEGCDDGNTTANDGCSATCTIESGFVCSPPQVSVCTRAPPVITAPANGAFLNTTTPVISGTGVAGATVTVVEGATTRCTATVTAGGTWSCTSSAMTANASHTLTATQTLSGFTSNNSNAVTFTIDTVAPAQPVVSSPSGTVGTATPVISGTAEANSTVRVFIDGGSTAVCTATASGTGAWSCTSTALADGLRSATATATDAAGNVSAAIAARTFTVDTVTTVSITAPTAGQLLNSATPTLSGTGENGATIVVREGATTRCSATVASGTWSCTSGTLTDGSHTLVATATDGVSNTATASVTFSTDTVTTVSITAPTAGATLATATPGVSGTGENGATIVVREGATTRCSATVASGTWSCTSGALTDGSHTLVATATDAAGNTATASVTFTTDTTTTVSITLPTGGVTVATSTPSISGTGETGATIVVREGATARCSTTVVGGVWSCTSATLVDGAHTFVATATDTLGNTATASVTFTTDTVTTVAITAPAAGATLATATPGISGTGENGATIVVREGAATRCSATVASGTWSCTSGTLTDGSHTLVATATDAAGNTATANVTFSTDTVTTVSITAPAAGATLATATPSISGTGENGATIVVREGATTRCSATVAAGVWSCTSGTLTDGSHTLVATATDTLGNTATASVTFTTDTVTTVSITAPTAGQLLNTATPVISGAGENGATIVVREGATTRCTTTVASGTWSCTSGTLTDGAHTLVATATDTVGNTATASVTFTTDTVTDVSITAPTAGATLATAMPTVSGTGENGASIVVREGATTRCSATVASGTWSCTSDTLTDGSHTLVATATDAAGNTATASVTFSTDTVTNVAITAPANGAVLATATPGLSGTGENGATIVVREGATTRCTATVATGTWSCTSATLTDGAHTFVATATDAVGNTATVNVSFTTDTVTDVAITAPANGAVLASATPGLSGTGEDGASIVVREGATTRCTATVAAGTWSCTSSTLTDGAHALVATATDSVGNTATASVTFTTDTVAPVVAISTPANGAVLTSTSVTISGTVSEPALVSVGVTGGASSVSCLPATNITTGTWSCSVTLTGNGETFTIAAHAVDAAGNTDDASSTFVLDTTRPAAPVITVAPALLSNDTTPTFTGTAEPNSTVAVAISDGSAQFSCSATVDSSGNWSCTATVPSAAGSYTATATATDAAGNVSDPSAPAVGFAIDVSTAVTFDAPVDGALSNDANLALSGTAEVGAEVVLTDATRGELCRVTVLAGGAWSCAPTLGDGVYAVTAVSTDAAGNTASAGPVGFTIDTSTFVTLTAPVDGSGFTDAGVSFSGAGEASATVTVTSADGGVVCSAAVGSGGAWSCDVTLADGTYVVSAQAVDLATNTASAGPVSFVVDTTAPAVPAFSSPDAGAVVTTASPTLVGTGEASSVVSVFEGTTLICTATVDALGAWSCVPTAALIDGDHTFVARARDTLGNTSGDSASLTITVDTAAPAIAITQPTQGATLTTATPVISGTGEDGSTVTVSEGGTTVCSATVSGGLWSCTASTLSQGAHAVTAVAVDGAGNSSPATAARDFFIDSLAPDAPVISAPTAGQLFSVASVVVSGTAEAGSTVNVFADGATSASCTVTADATTGAWSCPAATFADGAHTVQATATDAAGNVSVASVAVAFVVDTTRPLAVVITAPGDGAMLNASPVVTGTAEPGALVTVYGDAYPTPVCTAAADATSGAWSCTTSLADGEYLLTAIAADAAGHTSPPASVRFTIDRVAPAAPVILAPVEGAITASTTTFSGTSEPGATVRVELDGASTAACTAMASLSGTWACAAVGLTPGAHSAVATATDAASNVSLDSSARSFTVSVDAPPAPPVITSPIDGATVGSTTVEVRGVAAPGSTVRVSLDASAAACTTVAAADGTFSCTLSSLSEGPHAVFATATANAQTSAPSATVDFTVDLTAPAAPVITRPVSGATTSSTPVISGTAEAGATVSVYLDGATSAACTATANAAGLWACVPTTALADGAHTAQADATDAAGHTSARSTTVGFLVVSGTPVGAPVITAPPEGAQLSETRPVIEGVAEPFSVVRVTLDGATTPTCTVVAAADGAFLCTPGADLSEGSHLVNATAEAGGNTSAPSTDVHFTIDTIAPSAPVITAPVDGSETDRQPPLRGTAGPGLTVDVRVDGQVVCTTVADVTGAWSCTLNAPLPPGAHVAVATASDAAGNRSPDSAPVGFTVLGVPQRPVITAPAAGEGVFDFTPTVSGVAEPGSTVTVSIDGVEYCVATASDTGAFSCEGTSPLSRGQHSATAESTNAGGSTTSMPVSFAVDEHPPAAPHITAPAEGALTFDATPDFSGTAEAGALVSVRVDGVEVCTATADVDGRFTCTAASALADGAHRVTAIATRNGLDSAEAATVRFTVGTRRPTVTSPTGGGSTGTAPTITGTAPPGSHVTVTVNGQTVCETNADAAGNWSCTPSTRLTPGTATFQVAVADDAGQQLESDPLTVHVLLGSVIGGGIGAGCSATPTSSMLWLGLLVLGFLVTRRRAAGVAMAAVVSVSAQAQVTVEPFELEKARLNPGAADGLLQEGGKLLDAMSLRVSLLGHYENTPLVIRDETGKVTPLVQGRVTAHLGAAFGITDWLEAGLQLPVVLAQPSGSADTGFSQVATGAAMGTPWVQLRGAPLRERAGHVMDLAIGVAVGFPVGSKAALSRDNTVTAVPSIGVGRTLNSFLRLGGNVSFNIRPATGLGDGTLAKVGSSMTIGAVLSTAEWNKFRFELSGRADIPFTKTAAGGELYLGARYSPIPQLELMLIGGPGFGSQPGTPSFRVLLGAAYNQNFKAGPAPVPLAAKCVAGEPHDAKACPELDLDGDGVKNADDACAEVLGLTDNHGCPDHDSDGDGVLDLADKCVKVPGVRELDGCPEPDADKDGIADARDACVNAAGPATSDGCPDTDGDGFHDGVDACVNELGVDALRGCPDVDTDGDKVVDRLDNCPKEKGVAENQGCPAKVKQLVIITQEKLLILDKIQFASGKATILPKSQPLMKQLAQVMVDHPNVAHIRVEGHTDNVGKPAKNLTLSQQRADAVMNGLVKLGVEAARLEAVGYGDTKPIANNLTVKGKEANRRVEFTIVNP